MRHNAIRCVGGVVARRSLIVVKKAPQCCLFSRPVQAGKSVKLQLVVSECTLVIVTTQVHNKAQGPFQRLWRGIKGPGGLYTYRNGTHPGGMGSSHQKPV
jgi:hypothetical protein